MYQRLFKRLIDITFALIVLIILSPVLLIVVIWLLVDNEGAGVIFTQPRPGKDGKIFNLYKFKSMNDKRGSDGELLPDEQRLTRAGRLVRSTSLDELPQLINVLKGDMSLIGPRPLLVQYLPLYTPRQMRRHEVRPGISGWAQCHGRNALRWAEKFEYDVWYVDHCSFLTDVKVVLSTLRSLVVREGISSATSATMEPFTGNN